MRLVTGILLSVGFIDYYFHMVLERVRTGSLKDLHAVADKSEQLRLHAASCELVIMICNERNIQYKDHN